MDEMAKWIFTGVLWVGVFAVTAIHPDNAALAIPALIVSWFALVGA